MLCWEDERVVQRDWTVSWQGRYFQIDQEHEALCLVGKKITVRELRDGTIQLLSIDQKLHGTELSERPKPKPRPKVAITCETVPALPAANHPWRNFGVGTGKQFWRGEKARSQAARQAARGLRSASASLRPPSVPGQPAIQSSSAQKQTTINHGDIFS